MENENNVYHVCTNGLARDLWFFDDEDYIDGMNSVAVCALEARICIYCFCLMSNHVHFIVRGEENDCIRFIREYKRRRSLQMTFKYKTDHQIQGADVYLSRIDDLDYLRRAIAYVMRNPLAAGLAVTPTDYRWSSSNIYFADRAFSQSTYRRMGEFSLRCKRRMFKSKVQFPDDYLVDSYGTIFPGSYVDFRAVEGFYGSPSRFLYFLSITNDASLELDSGILNKLSYKDSELRVSMEIVCEEKFRRRKYEMLRIEERYALAREMRKRYGVGAKQLARVMSLDYESLRHIF